MTKSYVLKDDYPDNVPEFMPIRGSEITDPKTGKIIRHAEDGIVNVRVDRLEWLLAHKHIDRIQHAAGRRLQSDSEQAQIGGYATMDGGRSGGGTNRLPDAKCDAIARVNDARAYVGNAAWRMLELVVMDGVSVSKAETIMRLPYRHGPGALLVALDVLARHYGLC